MGEPRWSPPRIARRVVHLRQSDFACRGSAIRESLAVPDLSGPPAARSIADVAALRTGRTGPGK